MHTVYCVVFIASCNIFFPSCAFLLSSNIRHFPLDNSTCTVYVFLYCIMLMTFIFVLTDARLPWIFHPKANTKVDWHSARSIRSYLVMAFYCALFHLKSCFHLCLTRWEYVYLFLKQQIQKTTSYHPQFYRQDECFTFQTTNA